MDGRHASLHIKDGLAPTLQGPASLTDGVIRISCSRSMPASETRATFWLDSPRRASSSYVPDPLNNGQLTSPTYQYRYNDQGQMTKLTDPLGRNTRFVFNDQGQQLSRTLPLGFGPDGKFGTVDDPVGWPHLADANAPPAPGLPSSEQSQYDIRGRQTLHVSFEGVVTRFQYDDTPHGYRRPRAGGAHN